MANETWLQRKIRSFAGRVGYETERLILNVNEQIQQNMEDRKVTRADLARELDVTKGYISRLLNNTPNMTLRTLVSIATAVGCRVSVTIAKQESVAVTRPNIRDFESYLLQRHVNVASDDGPALMTGYKRFVPPVPAPEKQNAAA
jgi:transcriptional regulator with XRE-family HTH domain